MKRKTNRLVRGLALAAIVGAFLAPIVVHAAARAAPTTQAVPTSAGAPLVAAVDSIGLTVSDMDRSLAFYTGALGFQHVSDAELSGDAYEHFRGVFGARARVARLRLGDEYIELTQFLAPEGRPAPADSRSNDRWFQHIAIVVSDMDRAYAVLREHNVRHASTGPQTLPAWNTNAAGISAFYFKDPDGHPLEIIHFPAGKGDPRWQRPTGRLFLGIDHTAIVVADTDASLRLYRDTLGMRIAGASENYGPEQERLNNVFGARLRITSLRAAAGPGVELLEYLAPGDGRPYPPDERANDLVHWSTRFVAVTSASDAAGALFASRARFVSPGAIDLPGSAAPASQALTARDPDGHAIEVVSPAAASAPATPASNP